MSRFRPALDESDLWEGEVTGIMVDGIPVLVVRVEGEIYAYVDRCAHLGFPLSRGGLSGCLLTCKAHGWQFDVKTGYGVNPEAVRLQPLRVAVERGWIMVELPEKVQRGAVCAQL